MDLGIEAIERNPYPGLVISRPRIEALAVEVISSAANFCHVVEDDAGVIVGALSATTFPMAFYERRQAQVLQFYCKVPPWGLYLIKRFLVWARGRPAIKMIQFTLENDADPRVGRLLERLGLTAECPVYVEVR